MGDYDIGLETDITTNTTEGGIFVSSVKKHVCDIIVDGLPENIDLTVNGSDDPVSCTNTNKMIFYYNAITDALENNDLECAGPVVNGKCEPCPSNATYSDGECICNNTSET
ncbi:MAG: hypothetical protein IKV03_02190 [Alphaproteobacteria bacterium]|nr:hypothetical protein [Alphaproteobacteria bacterium]